MEFARVHVSGSLSRLLQDLESSDRQDGSHSSESLGELLSLLNAVGMCAERVTLCVRSILRWCTGVWNTCVIFFQNII